MALLRRAFSVSARDGESFVNGYAWVCEIFLSSDFNPDH